MSLLLVAASILKANVKIDALDQWCLRKLLGIKLYHHVRNDEVRRTTGQPRLSAIVQARRLSLFRHIARMPDETGWMDGWLGFNGILSTQVAAISCLRKFKVC